MIQRILIAIAVFILVAILITIFVSDIPKEIREKKDEFPNPLAFLFEENEGTTTEDTYHPLYDFPKIMLPGVEEYDGDGEYKTIEDIRSGLVSGEKTYDELRQEAEDVKEFGTPSPFRNSVSFSTYGGGATESSPAEEYLRVHARSQNTSPVNLTGWSLQSIVTGMRIFIPQGVRVHYVGTAPALEDIYLEPGKEATLTSGPSPIGTSFEENMCTGYLEQFQDFGPSLSMRCPAPRDEMPLTAETLREFGSACVDFVRALPRCTFYLDDFPDDVTPECKGFVQGALSYSGCVARNRWRPSFSLGDWRVFLWQRHELWGNTHDVIRLLDREGRTVDILSY